MMADPNQTPARGDWLCPCNGCKKAAKQERERIISLIESMDSISDEINAYGFQLTLLDKLREKEKK